MTTNALRLRTAVFGFWMGALALVTACNEGHKMPTPPFDSKSTPWTELSIPGVELFVSRETSPPHRAWGGARLDGASRELRGKPAFDAVRARTGDDPTTLATLAMLLLEDGVAGKKPWTRPDGPQVQDQQAIARPPAVSGDTLVYWRFHEQLADLVRCKLGLQSGKIACELGGDVLQAERVGKDPSAAAKQYLASDSASDRARGVQALGEIGDDHARQQLREIAVNGRDPRERKAAVKALGKTGGTDAVTTLSRVLLEDKFDEVRQLAATVLGELRDPAARDALERAVNGDSDVRVQVLAAQALKQLK